MKPKIFYMNPLQYKLGTPPETMGEETKKTLKKLSNGSHLYCSASLAAPLRTPSHMRITR